VLPPMSGALRLAPSLWLHRVQVMARPSAAAAQRIWCIAMQSYSITASSVRQTLSCSINRIIPTKLESQKPFYRQERRNCVAKKHEGPFASMVDWNRACFEAVNTPEVQREKSLTTWTIVVVRILGCKAPSFLWESILGVITSHESHRSLRTAACRQQAPFWV